MKVKELIVELQKHDLEADIVTEGCDCFGEPGPVVTLEKYFTGGAYAGFYVGNKKLILTRKGETQA